jgi:hypothetical protein
MQTWTFPGPERVRFPTRLGPVPLDVRSSDHEDGHCRDKSRGVTNGALGQRTDVPAFKNEE